MQKDRKNLGNKAAAAHPRFMTGKSPSYIVFIIKIRSDDGKICEHVYNKKSKHAFFCIRIVADFYQYGFNVAENFTPAGNITEKVDNSRR